MESGKTREIVVNALKEFRTSTDPDDRLSSLQKISQLVEDTTDEELFELASAIALDEDHRLRGEICYAISRSQRPKLVKFAKEMLRDESPYVRGEAITAINELVGINETTQTAVETLLSIANELKSILERVEIDLSYIRNNLMKFRSLSPSIDEIIMDERQTCWETYLRHEKELLRDHSGKYVAIYKGEIVGIDESDENLAKMIQNKYGTVTALICKIEEEAKEPIQLPPNREIIS